jgi:CDP-diacylglycerol--glycerol-3-phosphate 3-phosphatidyltransferase
LLLERRALPNAITLGRIVLAPVVLGLLFVPTFTARFLSWILFLIAAFSDLWDGYLARKHGWISDFGKFVDPIADKLLLVATFVPFYTLPRRPDAIPTMPLIRTFPRRLPVNGRRP